MLYIDIDQWEHPVRGAQYDKAIWCWRKLSNIDVAPGWFQNQVVPRWKGCMEKQPGVGFTGSIYLAFIVYYSFRLIQNSNKCF